MIDKELLIERWKKIDKKKINQWETIQRRVNPNPIPKVTEEGLVICPVCGAKAVMSSKIRFCRPPEFTYFCTECNYRVASAILIEEVEIV